MIIFYKYLYNIKNEMFLFIRTIINFHKNILIYFFNFYYPFYFSLYFFK